MGEGATAMAGVALIAVIAAIDVAINESAVLIPLLVLGPLVAAVRATPPLTAAVAALAIAVAVALGPVDQGLFAPQHVVQVIVVLGGSVFALAAATARDRYERAERAASAALAGERAARIQANMVARASELLATAPDPEERLAQVVALAVPELADVGTVDLLMPDGSLRAGAADAAEPGVAQAVLDARRTWPVEPESDHPVAIAARTGTPQLVREMTPEHLEQISLAPGHLEHMRRLQYSSGIAVPLLARGRTLGVFAFVRRAGREPFNDDDLRLAVELGRRSATALDNARLFAELSRTERQLEAVLGNLAEAVTVQAPDLRLVYVNQAAARLLECSSPEEVLSTPMTEILGRFVALDENGHPFDYAKLPGRDALAGRTPEPVLIRSISRATGEERWMVVKASPVRDEDGAVVMAVNIMEDVTDARRAEHQQRFLASASKLLSSSLDVDATLERAAWAMVPELADWCCIDVPDERGRMQRRALAADPGRHDELEALRAAIDLDGTGPGQLGAVLRDAEPRLFDSVDEATLRAWAADDQAFKRLRALGARSVIAVPLMAGERPTGLMTMVTDVSARRLGPAELELAREVAARAAIAIENARVHATRTHIATTLQRSLLPPRLPAVPGMTIAARFRAAGGSSEVGGDFYDLFPVEDAWMVLVGDVTGKGPEAAAITSLARYTMRTAAEYERTPAGVLERLNAALVVDPDRRRICTVVCARIVTEPDGSAEVRVACGGHPPPFRLHDGRAEAVAVAGPLLGAFEGGRWQEAALRLAPGESLVLYTDGVTDTRSAAERFGAERLEAVLSGAADLEADEVADRVDRALLEFEDGPQRDDVALLVLRAGAGTGAEASLVATGAAVGAP
ncbi:MAG TPA: SpoIIE family protein phosphatase [Solirubrobacteraceae bacterium]|nr:SpoIIE family protein phosphatase [Solirubrobacteraceae bacterium]